MSFSVDVELLQALSSTANLLVSMQKHHRGGHCCRCHVGMQHLDFCLLFQFFLRLLLPVLVSAQVRPFFGWHVSTDKSIHRRRFRGVEEKPFRRLVLHYIGQQTKDAKRSAISLFFAGMFSVNKIGLMRGKNVLTSIVLRTFQNQTNASESYLCASRVNIE